MIKKLISHPVFLPALVGSLALIVGLLFAFEHSRNLIKVRGPYLLVLAVIISFPIFAFKFFDPHEDPRAISVYFVAAGIYYIMLGSPDLVIFFRMLIIEKLPRGAMKHLILGLSALGAIAGATHYAFRINEEHEGFLRIPWFKFSVYAILQVIYLNLFVAIAREKFGISTVLS